ncbi:unnamed protein product [Oppiella nova]|uniref:C2H2-type domain-containing protein n=1 Tax=Oppiella nova TaxID=334625 RepID=A0A7R9M3P9_9ACAR|nr:unnamed protein product [Oppiella nova]CAG2170189.1 unnamed protein product [Oppiella nova]
MVYGLGPNWEGCLGLGHNLAIDSPQVVRELCYQKIRRFFIGYDFVLAMNSVNHMYSWGHNMWGQLGRDVTPEKDYLKAERISYFDDKDFQQISCGSHHSLALTSDGQVYGWGCNREGQVGKSFALNFDGHVFIWGNNIDNQLGPNMLFTESIFVPQFIPTLINIKAIACKLNMSYFLSNSDFTKHEKHMLDKEVENLVKIIHRDLKPENILIAKNFTTKTFTTKHYTNTQQMLGMTVIWHLRYSMCSTIFKLVDSTKRTVSALIAPTKQHNMGSISGDFRRFSRRQLWSTIMSLSRQNDCLKTDLTRFELMSKIHDKYVSYLRPMCDTIDANIANTFVKQINALKAVKKGFVCLESDATVHELANNLNHTFTAIDTKVVNELSNNVNEKSVSHACGASDSSESLDQLMTRVGHQLRDDYEDNRRAIEDLNRDLHDINRLVAGILNKSPKVENRSQTVVKTTTTGGHSVDDSDDNEGHDSRGSDYELDELVAKKRTPIGGPRERYVCGWKDCHKWFTRADNLNRHKAQAHIKIPKYRCNWESCGKQYRSVTLLNRHKQLHRSEKAYRCDIPGCSAVFAGSPDLERHKSLKNHPIYKSVGKKRAYNRLDAMSGQYRCRQNGCGKRFSHKYKLNRHQICHKSIGDYRCEGCGVLFKRLSSLKRHKERHPCVTYRCDIPDCPSVLTSKRSLGQHKRRIHHSKYGSVAQKPNSKTNSKSVAKRSTRKTHLKHRKPRKSGNRLSDNQRSEIRANGVEVMEAMVLEVMDFDVNHELTYDMKRGSVDPMGGLTGDMDTNEANGDNSDSSVTPRGRDLKADLKTNAKSSGSTDLNVRHESIDDNINEVDIHSDHRSMADSSQQVVNTPQKRTTSKRSSLSDFKCPYVRCNHLMASLDEFNRHMAKKHHIFQCDICHKMFNNQDQLMQHTPTHKIFCAMCSSVFPSQQALDEHLNDRYY